ncbi:sporulation integral membrane protein YtvI [Metabacillus indicus]|uniref:sporulation integral membrane protein YtvI n=1 Tax=Metabacillus indicus TaxID=246786 RepID=UPI0039844EC2
MNAQLAHAAFRALAVTAIIIAAAASVYYVSALAYPFIIGFLLASIINPFVDLLERRMVRGVAVFLSIACLVIVFAGMVTLLIAEIVAGTTYLASSVPEHFKTLVVYIETFTLDRILPVYEDFAALFNTLDASQQKTILANIQHTGEQVGSNAAEFLKEILENIPLLISWLPNAATAAVFSLLAAFFISKDWYKFQKLLRKYLPVKARKSGRSVADDLKKALFGFIKAQIILISITTVTVLIGLLLLRVDYAITIALLIGLVDLLPYLGTGLVFVPWIIYSAFSGELPFAIGLGALYLIILMQRQLIEPKILSSTIGLDPLATLLSLFVGFKLIGFLGLIAGPVALVIFNALQNAGVFEDAWKFITGTSRD